MNWAGPGCDAPRSTKQTHREGLVTGRIRTNGNPPRNSGRKGGERCVCLWGWNRIDW